jgi:hypothetical protein
MSATPRCGDVFLVLLPDGTYLSGRLLLDFKVLIDKGLLQDSPLRSKGEAFLVEMHSRVVATPVYRHSPVLIPGAFLANSGLPQGIGYDWPIVGHQRVTPHELAFPEELIGYIHAGGEILFQCGEIRFLLPLTDLDLDQINARPTWHNPEIWPYLCLHALGREDMLPKEYRGVTLARSDLRFSPHRARVYQHLPLDPNCSYYENQGELGLNIDRFFV